MELSSWWPRSTQHMSFFSRITWQRKAVSTMGIREPRREARWWLAYCILYFFASILIGWVIRTWPMPFWRSDSLTQDVTYIFFFKLFLLLTVPLVIYRRMGYRIADLTPGWRLGLRSLLPIAVGYGLGFVINARHLSWQSAARPNFGDIEFFARVTLGPVLAFLMAGFPEEFVFRGVLQTRMEAVWGRIGAILTTAILFTAWHIPPRYFNASGVEGTAGNLVSVLIGTGAPVFIVGLIFGLIWDRYRSFWPLVAAHTGVDTLPCITSLLGIPN